jgi:murein L,D-transpeptidase YcbB/YkuD
MRKPKRAGEHRTVPRWNCLYYRVIIAILAFLIGNILLISGAIAAQELPHFSRECLGEGVDCNYLFCIQPVYDQTHGYGLTADSTIHFRDTSRSKKTSNEGHPTLTKFPKSVPDEADFTAGWACDPNLASMADIVPEPLMRCSEESCLEGEERADSGLGRASEYSSSQSALPTEWNHLESSESDGPHPTQEIQLPAIRQSSPASEQRKEFRSKSVLQSTSHLELERILDHFQEIAQEGGWPIVPAGPNMKRGYRGERVAILRTRLKKTGDLDFSHQSTSDLFGAELELAVRKFQQRHGIDVDGIVGRKTLAALNVPVEARVEQIRLNIERLRESRFDFGRRFILINSASYELAVVEDGQTIIKMRAVVGRPDRPTPVFSGKMTYLVVNPYWDVPSSIAEEDILPKIRMNPDYLLEHNIKVFEVSEGRMVEVDPQNTDWQSVKADSFHYRLRPEPGPLNALGRVKFMFPNTFGVYIHDTSARELFEEPKRNYSSGCIRIEDPVDLAEYLLRGESEWSREKILATIDSGERRVVKLPEPIAVHLLYLTAWVDEGGSVQFRDDIYGRDSELSEGQASKIPISNS